jgi:hypothetical protein
MDCVVVTVVTMMGAIFCDDQSSTTLDDVTSQTFVHFNLRFIYRISTSKRLIY